MLNTTKQRYMLPTIMAPFYFGFTFSALVFCFISSIAMLRTRRTPYSTKLLSIGLLTFDVLFLISGTVDKLFSFEDIFYVRNSARGFQVASQLIVGFMALERLFVLNWPYVYLRVMTTGRTRVVCMVIFISSLLQYAIVRGAVCYQGYFTKNFAKCSTPMAIYLILVCFLVLVVSIISYSKIFRIIRQKEMRLEHRLSIKHYKGTMACFMFLLNTTITQIIYVGIVVFMVTSKSKEKGFYATIGDIAFVINCVVDPLIYVVWFKETQLEILKMLSVVCPCLSSTVVRIRNNVYSITGTQSFKTNEVVS